MKISELIKELQNEIDRYGDIFHIIRSPKNEGLLKSVDNLYSLVETPYIFHCEDDWLFKSNPNFIKESLDILEDNSNINQVWIREGIPTNRLKFKNKNGESAWTRRFVFLPITPPLYPFAHPPDLSVWQTQNVCSAHQMLWPLR